MQKCATCDTFTKGYRCKNCLQTSLYALNLPFDTAWVNARNAGLKEFFHECPIHGTTIFSAVFGHCIPCNTDPRIQARRLRAPTYEATCPTHGVTKFLTRTGLCTQCFTSDGMHRTAPIFVRDPVRIAARRNGERSYVAACPIHGEVPHSTLRGKCLTCFNTLGYPRPKRA